MVGSARQQAGLPLPVLMPFLSFVFLSRAGLRPLGEVEQGVYMSGCPSRRDR